MKYKTTAIIAIFFAFVVVFLLHGWVGYVLPLSPREENIPELSYAWNMFYAFQKGFLFSGWNPLQISGATNILQRDFWVLVPVVLTSFFFHISVDTSYKLFAGGLFFLSGFGMFQFLKQTKVSWFAACIGGLLYMLAPPHLAIAIEGFEFNVYWMIIPWILYCVEHFIQTGKLYRNAIIIALLAMVALPAGNTYFASTMPLFALYVVLKLFLSKSHKKWQFLLLTATFFITLSAWLIIPSVIESKNSWISQESRRKKDINLPNPQQLINLFPLRLRNHSVLAFDNKGNFTDMSWYLGLSTISLASLTFICRKKYREHIIPASFLVFIFVPGLLIKIGWLKPLFIEILKIIPLQAVYDHTFRLFLLPVFGFSVLGAFGFEAVLQKIQGVKKYAWIAIIVSFILWDFHPYADFFRATPQKEIDAEGAIIAQLNKPNDQIRYWSPFPYKRHLSLYRQEYMTRYTYRNRVNSSFLYIPFSPLYSGHLYDLIFTTILEPVSFDPAIIATALEWANVGFIILQSEVRDYTHVITSLKNYDFHPSYQSPNLIILKQNRTDRYVQAHSHIALVPFERKDDVAYWVDLAKQGSAPFFTEAQVSFSSLSNATNQQLEWNRERHDSVSVKTTFTQPTLISVSESFYPGWSVSIDQKPGQLLRTNYAFMGTIVPAGNHIVRFTYRKPWYYTAGLFISCSGLLLMILLIRKWK